MSDDRTDIVSELTGLPGDGLGGQITGVMNAVRRSPAAAVLTVGLLLVIVALVRKVGSFEFENGGPRVLTLVVGATLVCIGLGGPVLQARSKHRKLEAISPEGNLPPEAHDVEFLLKVFYLAMPPAFVKRISPRDSDSDPAIGQDILFSKQLVRFQDSKSTRKMPLDARSKLVKADHQHGDELALANDRSVQLELPDSYVNGKLRPIMTYKASFEHNGQTYIAGWYVPVETASIPKGAETVCLREEIDQVLFRLSLAKDGAGSRVSVGKAVEQAV